MDSMTAAQLQLWLKQHYPVENERHEWKSWSNLKHAVSGGPGHDLVSYVSALANMEGGCIVIGVKDKTLDLTGIRDFANFTPENIVYKVLTKTPGLPSLSLRVEVLQASDTAPSSGWCMCRAMHPVNPFRRMTKPGNATVTVWWSYAQTVCAPF